MRTPLAVPAAVAALVASGCGAFYAEIEQPRACITQHGVLFPPASLSGETEATVPVDVAGSVPAIGSGSYERELRYVAGRIALAAGSSLANLDDLESLTVDVVPPAGSGLAPLLLVDYRRAGPTGSALDLPPAVGSGANLVDYLGSGTLQLHIVARGSLPTAPWNADVRGCFYVRAKVTWGDLTR